MFGLGCAGEYQLVSVWRAGESHGKGGGEGRAAIRRPSPNKSTCRQSPTFAALNARHAHASGRMNARTVLRYNCGSFDLSRAGALLAICTLKLCAGGVLYGASLWVRCANARSCGRSALPAAVHRAQEVSPNSIHGATRGLLPAASTPPHAPQAAPSIGCGQQQPAPHGYQA
jgi:hypothetical protein